MERKNYLILSFLVLLFFLMEYLYLPAEGNTTPVKIVFKDFSIRLDSYVYFAAIKVEQFIFVVVLHIILPMKDYTKWLVYSFLAAIVEYPLTYNEPIYKLPLPLDFYIPVSTASLKFTAVAYFMTGCVRKFYG